MSNILVVTSDLPFFPGRNGHDFFNIRYLSSTHSIGVVGPCYSQFSKSGVANLESICDEVYFWPRKVDTPIQCVEYGRSFRLKRFIEKIPRKCVKYLLGRLLGIDWRVPYIYRELSVFSNCAPYVLKAITDKHWDCLVLIQSSSAVWLDYLPSRPARLAYFHDIRSDYLSKAEFLSPTDRIENKAIDAIQKQEKKFAESAEMVGFVSQLDQERGKVSLGFNGESGVAEIPVDTKYYVPAPREWENDVRPIVLFTGHLSHPPNVDAVEYFISKIWMHIKEKVPGVVFQVVGRMPSPVIVSLAASDESIELYSDVPDIRPYFWNANVYVVPMRYGGGVRQKIFEAWAMKVAVVCTTMAVEGTRAEDRKNCWLEDDPVQYASRVVELLLPTINSNRVLKSALESVNATNTIKVAAKQFESLVNRSITIKLKKPYKVLLDLRWMEIGKAGGAEQMAFELVSAMSKLDKSNYFRFHCPRSTYYEWDFPRKFHTKGIFVDEIYRNSEVYRSSCIDNLCERLDLQPIMNTSMRSLRKYREMDFDFVHSLNGYIQPDLEAFPNLLTVLDLQHIHYPKFFSPEEWEAREVLYRKSTENAEHITCISDFVRQDLHRKYDIPMEKMSTVRIIPSQSAWVRIDKKECSKRIRKLGIFGPYFLYPAHCWPHKNHKRLVEAFAAIRSELVPGFKLVLTGAPFKEDHPARILIEERGLSDTIVHLGYRSPLELRCLFQKAEALVFPSLFEGYGMPVAEAIISKTPVICSNVTSLPEIAGKAAVMFNPQSTEEIASSMLRITKDTGLRIDLIEESKIERKKFNARKIAIQTLSLYRRVFEELV